MEQPEQPVRKPSLFSYSVVGYIIANAFGIPAVVVMSIRAGDYHEQAALQLLACTGAFGAMIGFQVASSRRKAFGGGGMGEEWKQFWGSLPSYGLVAIVLGGSAVITVLGSLIAIAVMGPTTPK